MKCEYCGKEIPPGTEVIDSGHYFCSTLHRYSWQEIFKKDLLNTGSNEDLNNINNFSFNASNEDPSQHADFFDKNKEMKLGDIFSNAFNLLKTTFLRDSAIAAILLIPTGILLSFGIQNYFSLLGSFKSLGETGTVQADPQNVVNLFSGLFVTLITTAIFMMAFLAVTIGITEIVCREMEGERISIGSAFRKIFSFTYLRGIGQFFVFGFFFTIAFLLIILSISFASAIDNTAFTFITVLIVLAVVFISIYLYFRWYFVLTAIVHTDGGVFESFSLSFSMVKGNWWRTFGLIILITFVVDFAVSLITTPISFILLWGYISQFMKMSLSNSGSKPDPAFVFKMMSSFGFNFSIVIILSTVLQMILTTIFNIVLYFDLRIRKRHSDYFTSRIKNNLPGELSY